jgi:hypothetical protein
MLPCAVYSRGGIFDVFRVAFDVIVGREIQTVIVEGTAYEGNEAEIRRPSAGTHWD